MAGVWLSTDLIKQARARRLESLTSELGSGLEDRLAEQQQIIDAEVIKAQSVRLPGVDQILGPAPATPAAPTISAPSAPGLVNATPSTSAPGLVNATPSTSVPSGGSSSGGGGGYAPSTPGPTALASVEQWSPLISQAAKRHNVPEAVVKGIMQIESGGDPKALSHAGAIGLMQTMPFHYQPGEDAYDPATNIDRGVKILADNYRRYGDWDRAAAAYFGAIDANGNITDASDGNTVGSNYVRLFREAAANYGGLPAAPVGGQAAASGAAALPPSGAAPPPTPGPQGESFSAPALSLKALSGPEPMPGDISSPSTDAPPPAPWDRSTDYPYDIRNPGYQPYQQVDAEGVDRTNDNLFPRPAPAPDYAAPPDDMMYRQPISLPTPGDSYPSEYQDPDAGPREALPGSVGASPLPQVYGPPLSEAGPPSPTYEVTGAATNQPLSGPSYEVPVAPLPPPQPEAPSGMKRVWDAAGNVIGYVKDTAEVVGSGLADFATRLPGGVSSAVQAIPDAARAGVKQYVESTTNPITAGLDPSTRGMLIYNDVQSAAANPIGRAFYQGLGYPDDELAGVDVPDYLRSAAGRAGVQLPDRVSVKPSDIAGFAGEAVLDPTNFMTGGAEAAAESAARSVTGAGRGFVVDLAQSAGEHAVTGFYSQLRRIVETKIPNRATPDQVLGVIRNAGVKPDEIYWSGIEDFLGQQGGRVTKEAILNFLDEAGVQLREVVKGGPLQQTWMSAGDGLWRSPETRYTITQTGPEQFVWDSPNNHRGQAPTVEAAQAQAFDDYREGVDLDSRYGASPPTDTRWSNIVMPGPSKDYRELLLTLPDRNADRIDARLEQLDSLIRARENAADPVEFRRLQAIADAADARSQEAYNRARGHPMSDPIWGDYEAAREAAGEAHTAVLRHREGDSAELRAEYRDLLRQKEALQGENYSSSHWDEPNILAHIRFDERTTPGSAGNRIPDSGTSVEDYESMIRQWSGHPGLEQHVEAAKRELAQLREQNAAEGVGPQRVLFINEIQSDWHQQGRKHGYRSDPWAEPYTELPEGYTIQQIGGQYVVKKPDGQPLGYGDSASGPTPEEATRRALQYLNTNENRFGNVEALRAREAELQARRRELSSPDAISPELQAARERRDQVFAARQQAGDAYMQARQARDNYANELEARGATNRLTPEQQARLDELDANYNQARRDLQAIDADIMESAETVRSLEQKATEDVDRELREIGRQLDRADGADRRRVPNAPFRRSWQELAIKRMIRWAAENGFDRIAWTKGHHQVQMEGLAGHIDRLDWIREGDNWILEASDSNGAQLAQDYMVSDADLDATVGPATAAEMRRRTPAEGGTPTNDLSEPVRGTLYGDQLREFENNADLNPQIKGMEGFYDKILVDTANRVGKKFGARTEDIDVAAYHGATESVHSLPITPEMRASVMGEGQPMFAQSPEGWGSVGGGPGMAERMAVDSGRVAGSATLSAGSGAVSGFTAGVLSSPDDATWQDRLGRGMQGASIGLAVGGVAGQAATLSAARLIDSLIKRGRISESVVEHHPVGLDRIKALFALAAEGLPDDEVVDVPGMAQFIGRRTTDAVTQELLAGATAGRVRELVAQSLGDRLLNEVAGVVTDLLTGLGGRAQRAREVRADRATVVGLPANQRNQVDPRVRYSGPGPTTILGTSQEIQNPDILGFVRQIADELGVQMPRVYMSSGRETNAAVLQNDEFQPILVITRGLVNSGLTEAEMRAVLVHELAHAAEGTADVVKNGRLDRAIPTTAAPGHFNPNLPDPTAGDFAMDPGLRPSPRELAAAEAEGVERGQRLAGPVELPSSEVPLGVRLESRFTDARSAQRWAENVLTDTSGDKRLPEYSEDRSSLLGRVNSDGVSEARLRDELETPLATAAEHGVVNELVQYLQDMHELDVLRDFYRRGYEAMKDAGRSDMIARANGQRVMNRRSAANPELGYTRVLARLQVQQKRLDDLGPEAKQALNEAAEAVWSHNSTTLQRGVEAGRVDSGLAADLQQRYPHYIPTVPLETLDPSGRVASVGKGGASPSADTQKMVKAFSDTASGDERLNPLIATRNATIIRERQIARNRSFQAFARMWDEAYGADPSGLAASGGRRKPMSGEVDVHGWVDGELKTIRVPKPVADGIEQSAVLGLDGSAFAQWWAAAKNGVTMTLTGRRGSFAPLNLVRDLNDYTRITSAHEGGVQTFPRVLGAFGQQLGAAMADVLRGLGSSALETGIGGALGAGLGVATTPADSDPTTAAARIAALTLTGALLGGGRNIKPTGLAEEFLRRGGGMGIMRTDVRSGERWMRDIVKDGGAVVNTPADLVRYLKDWGWDALTLKAVQQVNERLELVPRTAAMGLAEKRGASPTEAMAFGRDATIDFNRGGTLVRELNQYIPFLNARVQGMAQTVRTLRDHPVAFAASTGAVLLPVVAGLEAWNRSDPRRAEIYNDIPEYEKQSGLIMVLPWAGSDARGSLPNHLYVPLGIDAPFANLLRTVLGGEIAGLPATPPKVGMDPQTDTLARWGMILNDALQVVSPIGGDSPEAVAGNLLPPGVKQAVEIGTNTSLFTGAPIASGPRDERSSAASQAISSAVNKLGQMLGSVGMQNVRPSQVEYGLNQLPAYGDIVRGVSDMVAPTPYKATEDRPIQNFPVVGGLSSRFVRDTGGENFRRAAASTLSPSLQSALADAGVRPEEVTPVGNAINGVPLSREERVEWQQRMNDQLDAQVSYVLASPGYNSPNADKASLMLRAINKARQLAGAEVLRQIPKSEQTQRMQEAADLKLSAAP